MSASWARGESEEERRDNVGSSRKVNEVARDNMMLFIHQNK